MAVVNTLTQSGGFIPDGQANASEAGAGTLEGNESKGVLAHRTAPHLAPAGK